ncbi:DUF4249 domain-containing protein [Gillisia sp. JM1]|uniref:DUF4249 domain-containing protein n=1 Tax=Gillisia sp. JM1 TaxID=1283286 RepID=UPI0004136636|nr:DUF4249 domain-containing protein [Gillisia sp. JM1]
MMDFIKHRDLKISWYFSLVAILFCSCVEPYDIETKTFESALVVEGTITDQRETQEIKLSRTFRLEENNPAPENDAKVKVVGDDGVEYFFSSIGEGIYHSNNQFRAISGVNYSLEIMTEDGSSYASKPSTLSGTSIIDDISAIRTVQTIDGLDSDGIVILVDSRNASASSIYYRYTFEETYKIKSQYNVQKKLIVTEGGGLEVVWKEEPDNICYRTEFSNDIILTNTNLITDNNIEKAQVHFIDKSNTALAYRYSILVKQYSLSREAYEFYEILKELSGSESLFSQNQPGFINGNLFSLDNPNEKVLGYFSVSAVDSKRLFFSFTDFFDLLEFPRSKFDCSITRPDAFALLGLIESGIVQYYGDAGLGSPSDEGEGPYRVANIICIDCRILGTTEVPEFWIE